MAVPDRHPIGAFHRRLARPFRRAVVGGLRAGPHRAGDDDGAEVRHQDCSAPFDPVRNVAIGRTPQESAQVVFLFFFGFFVFFLEKAAQTRGRARSRVAPFRTLVTFGGLVAIVLGGWESHPVH